MWRNVVCAKPIGMRWKSRLLLCLMVHRHGAERCLAWAPDDRGVLPLLVAYNCYIDHSSLPAQALGRCTSVPSSSRLARCALPTRMRVHTTGSTPTALWEASLTSLLLPPPPRLPGVLPGHCHNQVFQVPGRRAGQVCSHRQLASAAANDDDQCSFDPRWALTIVSTVIHTRTL